MLKKLLIALCLGAFIIAAMGAGCKKEPTEPEEPKEPNGEEPVEPE